MNLNKAVLLISVSLLLISCRDEIEELPDISNLPFGDPMTEGIDEERLETLQSRLSGDFDITSFLIVKNGKIVFESYQNTPSPNSLRDVRSVTKSIVATLTFIAIDKGYLRSEDDRIGDYLKDNFELSQGQRNITVRSLLTMSSGIDWRESGTIGYGAWISSEDHVEYLLDRPLTSSPGEVFNYNSAAVHLLGVLIQEASNMSLPEFAEQYLFEPLNIGPVSWENLPGEYVNGGSGIDMHTHDLAKIGLLYLQDGVSGGKRIFSKGWISRATKSQFDWRANYGSLESYSYGYLWWTVEEPFEGFLAWGYGGQFIFVIPEFEMVIVSTTNWINQRDDHTMQLKSLEFVFEAANTISLLP
jgi:CubicO group peptidase (beta-lactamase class C family)